ncbi:chitinase [Microdochium trichocladiopsis]|uniref:chitinase n=1 Tax=Microdochium trichocladiopsis TaxID=1682393 RepID=A0A9P9BP24_9PEZI|nr:chitinase [Microdochium trichocladiopsis]KAH7028812.1 chitinase [Microdochium trichocladiopsis]
MLVPAQPWLSAALGASALFARPGSAIRLSSAPSYSGREVCPDRCSDAGPNVNDWSLYPDMKKMSRCSQSLFFRFSLDDPVDDNIAGTHHIKACSSYGPDFTTMPKEDLDLMAVEESQDVNFEVGWWESAYNGAAGGQRSLLKQARTYLDAGHGSYADRPFTLFGQSGQATMGLYIGHGLLNKGISTSALKSLEDKLITWNVTTPAMAMQLCEPDYGSAHTFGIMMASNGTFSQIQDAMKTWYNGSCLSFASGFTDTVAGEAQLTMPLLASSILPSNNGTNSTGIFNSTLPARMLSGRDIHARADCRTVQVESGDSCGVLATKCAITPAEFTKINPASDFCAKLMPKQHVCCTTGTMPNFAPKPKPDGSCFDYEVIENDNCDNLAAEYSLTRQDLEDFNKKTWGWNGCKLLFTGTKMCLSKGSPPFPAVIPNAACGPQKPDTEPPTDGTNIADLNPCPLNACCNIWGQCGITRDFCVDTNTGAPGTAEPGTYGCISNCGTDVVKGDGAGDIRIGYFEGYALGRQCLYQDASQIDAAAYTHLHFGFGLLSPTFEVEVGDILSTYQFAQFKRVKGPKKILSFGGWDFSTFPDTYWIFREAVTPANRNKVAQNIANFIIKHELDGVDIDWEYPGAPDMPNIPPGGKDEGVNYLKFLTILKGMLPGKTVSIAAPSSFWYLKQYPIKEIGKVVDYIVYMTYDLHGQWDTDNEHSQEGCELGNCLRSQVNLTETKQSLAMITKAGVPGRKVIVGVTSYGRSFKMAQPGCWGPDCFYLGSPVESFAKKGVCTGTAGYIADAEIDEIRTDKRRAGRVTASFVDASSNSDVLVYDDTEWVAYMSPATKRTRASLYAAWGMGGTTDWATDLQQYHDVPKPATSWAQFKQMALSGQDPKADLSRDDEWVKLDCSHELVRDESFKDVGTLWKGLNADAAWKDIKRIWKDNDEPAGLNFIESVKGNLKIEAGGSSCNRIVGDNCNTDGCSKGMDGQYSGPAAMLIWNSLVTIRDMHKAFYDALYQNAATFATSLRDLENIFAPIPPEQDNTWLLLLLDLVTLGTLAAAGPFFNNFLKQLPKFAGTLGDNLKDTTMTLVGQSTTIAKDVLPSPKEHDWKVEDQDKFSNYMGQVIDGWTNATSLALGELMSGKPKALERLDKALAGGNLYPKAVEATGDDNELMRNIRKSFFGYAIPALWHASAAYPFIIDSGYGCDARNPISDYVDEETQEKTGWCDKGTNRLYYLVSPEGEAYDCGDGGCLKRKFSAPKGVDSLGDRFGGLTKDDIIKGSVRTYRHSGDKNNGGLNFANTDDPTTISDLLAVDVTTPGFIRLPVCSPERAFQSWDTSPKKGASPNYPCDNPPGRDYCRDSTFEDQTSGASPLASDCRQIIRNIEGDGKTSWTIQVAGLRQREIVKYGGCALGVEATVANGNVDFEVGGQDVIDLLNDAIKKFENRDGKIGAKGTMKCNGNIKDQNVKWGIY